MKFFNTLFVLLLVSAGLQAQVTDKAELAELIKSKKFVFNASAALPLNSLDMNRVMSRMQGGMNSGSMIQLNGMRYDVRLDGDTLKAYLPYYGRAFTAPYDQNDNGIKFSSTNFTYKETRKKKGGWVLVFNTKDVRDNHRFTLDISEKGYATLVANSNNRQSITFNGTIDKLKED
ncbi:hypothetical protein C7T94_00900 [Pedobacter yulinensis]|uniref:DUF4251 domain-containing protein n=1 Tax=Pedobacter yulinensis TaxID=2126353 RepID=A0A2T3HQP5_9SPHI|nr:DUF4251 domain-containing protein [Pedobacter yulinensis]PST84723.1 hypothetical protein C7T94_00900 [Pedobacter yulinensis]